MMQTAWHLGGLPEFAGLMLRKLGAHARVPGPLPHQVPALQHHLRRPCATAPHLRTRETFEHLELDPATVVVVNDWQHTGIGYGTDAERELAAGIAERVRAQRQRKYEKEGGPHHVRKAA